MNDVALVEAEARKAFLRTEQHHWLTIDEAAAVLGVSRDTLEGAVFAGHIELFAFGKTRRIHTSSLIKCQKALSQWGKPR